MTVNTVAVSDPILASTHQQIIANVNASPGRQIFTSNGTFSVPNGIHKFRVYIASGGQGGYPTAEEGVPPDSYTVDGAKGNDGFLVSAEFSGVEIGTSFAVVVGAGGAVGEGVGYGGPGGTSSFGATFSITGASTAGRGTVTLPTSPNAMYHTNGLYCDNTGRPYGDGGAGAVASPVAGSTTGNQGVVVVEW